MSRKFSYKSISPFHDRLYEIVGNDIPGWSKKIGVTPAAIRDKWLHNGSFPGVDKLMKISEYSGKTCDWILFGKDSPPPAPSGWPPEIVKACELVYRIMTSDNKVARDALAINLTVFEEHEVLKRDKEDTHARIEEATKDLKEEMKREIAALKKEHGKEIAYLKELYDRKIKSDT